VNIEQQIAELLALAEPYRCLPDDEPAKAPLTALVDQINTLRAKQSAPGFVDELPEATEEGADADDAPAKRGRGRPRKV